jgi:hypothetical protein
MVNSMTMNVQPMILVRQNEALCFRPNPPQGTVQTAGCFSATFHCITKILFMFCIGSTRNQTALYSFSQRVDQDQVRPLLHFENYASCNENGWSLNLMFSGTKDCHIPSLSDTLFSLPHLSNLGMYKCFCKICSTVLRFQIKKFSNWRETRACFKKINQWPSNTDLSGFGGLVVSMLVSGTQVRGFKPGQSRRSNYVEVGLFG